MTSQHDQYEGVAESYDQTFHMLPYREHIEAYSLFRLLGDLSGRAVLDLACGTGIFTRTIRRWGAARVVGVDISEDMVRVAREHEAEQPLDVEYVVGDVADLPQLGQFDDAVGIYLLGYADSRATIVAMARSIARNLRPGGRCVTYFVSPNVSSEPGYYRPYGVDFHVDPQVKDGDLMYFSLILGDTVTPRLSNYYWHLETVADAFSEAGFTNIRWIAPELSEQGRARYGDGFWDNYLKALPGIFLECSLA